MSNPTATTARIASLQSHDRGTRARILGDALEEIDCAFIYAEDGEAAVESMKLAGPDRLRIRALLDVLAAARASYVAAAAQLVTLAGDAMDAELLADEREAAADAREDGRAQADFVACESAAVR